MDSEPRPIDLSDNERKTLADALEVYRRASRPVGLMREDERFSARDLASLRAALLEGVEA